MAGERQIDSRVELMEDPVELDLSLEDAGELSGFGSQAPASVVFGSPSEHHVPNRIEEIFGPLIKPEADSEPDSELPEPRQPLEKPEPTQSLVAALAALVGAVGENEDQLSASLTGGNYQQLVELLDRLIEVVGENEDHFLAPLMDFVGKLIEKYQEESDMTTSNTVHVSGLAAAYGEDEPEYTLDMLINKNPDYEPGTSVSGLAAAYGEDEPEYTLDMLINKNPDYGS